MDLERAPGIPGAGRPGLLPILALLAAAACRHAQAPADPAAEPSCPFARESGGRIRPGILQAGSARIYHECEGKGPPVYLVHGAASHAHYHPVLSRLADRFSLVYYDQRGYGGTRVGGGEASTVDRDVADLEALRAFLGHDRIVLLAMSNGSPIGIDYALRFPDRVRMLVLVSGYADNDDRTGLSWALVREVLDGGLGREFERVDRDPALSEGERFVRRWSLTPHTHHERPVPREALELWHRSGIFDGDKAVRSTRDYRRLEDLPRLGMPVLVVAGGRDRITPLAHQRKVAEGIPRARLEVFEGSGHLLYLEEEERFLALMREALEEDGAR